MVGTDSGAGEAYRDGSNGGGPAGLSALQKVLSGAHVPASSAQPPKQVWLDAWQDPVAGVSAYTSCVHTCNLFGDGDNRLVVADEDRKLKVSVS
jgi:hypothetical protein